MRSRRWQAAVAVASVALAAAACSSSGSGGGGTSSGGSGASKQFPNGTIKVGYLTDESGVQSAVWTTAVKGMQIAVNAINKAGGANGQKIDLIVADAGSSAAGELSAAQELVQKDGVVAIMNMENYISAAEPTLLAEGVPVVGPGNDGTEWNDPKNTNLFNVVGNTNMNAVTPIEGQFVKDEGGTVCGSYGASDIPSVTEAATVFVDSCKLAGLKATPINSNIAYGSTNIDAVALQWKQEGVDSIFLASSPNVSFVLLAKLKQIGVTLKSSLLATGYDPSTISTPASNQASQGLNFSVIMQPIEANTPATKVFKAALVAGGQTDGVTDDELQAWASAWAVKAGLDKFGKPNPTRAQFSAALRSVNNYNANGMYSPHTINFGAYNVMSACEWVVQLKGNAFVPNPKNPYCGTATTMTGLAGS